MAKWGEGDPRWIVEERPDATNVNNWHWTEKNATPWSKLRLTELLKGQKIESPEATVTITELSRIDGEATANNRKAKLIFLYEWELKMKWEGIGPDEDEKVEGDIEIPNLSDEFTADEVDVDVSCKSSGELAERCKDLIRKKGTEAIRKQVAAYIKDLREEFSKGIVLPTKQNSQNANLTPKPSTDAIQKHKNEIVTSSAMKNMNLGIKISCKTLNLKETFKCRAEEIYNALTLPPMIEAFSRAPCQAKPIKGESFTLFNGMIQGEYLELVQAEKIRMSWRMKSYPSGHFSVVTMTFEEKDDSTEVRLEQTQIPDSNYDDTEDGWRRHYFESIRRTFGFGALLL